MPPKKQAKNKTKKVNDEAPARSAAAKKNADEKIMDDGEDDEVDDEKPATRKYRAKAAPKQGNHQFLFNKKQPKC